MTADTLTKESELAVKHFEGKLAFEIGPVGLGYALKDKLPMQIVDLRTPEYFKTGHVPGAINILLEDLDKNLGQLKKDVLTVVYCYNITCHLSTKAALELAKKGYQVKELYGGWQEYINAKQPVEGKPEAASCSITKNSCG